MAQTLMEGLQEELKRAMFLLKEYESLGVAGLFGATMIRQEIARAEKAIAEGDTVQMIMSYKELSENQ
jgi:hypothetical protein